MQDQAQAYESLVTEAPRLCGALPAGSQMYLAPDPDVWDLFGGFSSMAFNLVYEDVAVAPIPAAPEHLTSRPEAAVCIIAYHADGYRRLTPGEFGYSTSLGR